MNFGPVDEYRCTCDGCWACAGHEAAGCTCDVDWDAMAEERIARGAE